MMFLYIRHSSFLHQLWGVDYYSLYVKMMGIYLLFATSPRTLLCLKVFLGDALTTRKIPCIFVWLQIISNNSLYYKNAE